MTTVLVVDDNAMDRHFASTLLKAIPLDVEFAQNGKQAIELLDSNVPELVVTDLQMPEIDGLELVEHIRLHHPRIPVVLMTAYGSEDVAAEALRKGATSYVPKQCLRDELVDTVKNVLAISKLEDRRALAALNHLEAEYVLGARLPELDELIQQLQENMRMMRACSDSDLLRVGTALHEALVNANEHGNLEMDSGMREDESGAYHRLANERSRQPPYRDRRVYLRATLTRSEATFQIRDEGPGFDPSGLPDPTSPENLGKVSGRGLFLIRTFMDEVVFNDQGNEITMIKRRLR